MSVNEAGANSKVLALGLVREKALDQTSAEQCVTKTADVLSPLFGMKPICVWNRRRASQVVVNTQTAAEILNSNLLFRGQDATATHVLSIRAGLLGGAPDGSLVLSIARAAAASAELVMRMSDSCEASALREAFEALIEIWGVRQAWLGPAAAAPRKLGWLTFVDRQLGRVDEPLRSVGKTSGTIVIAHGLAPGAETPDALRGYEMVWLATKSGADLLRPRSVDEVPRADVGPAAYVLATPPAAIAPPPAETWSHVSNPDETLPIPSPYRVQPSLPFSGSTTPQRLAQLKASSPSMSDAERGEGVDETMMIRSPLRVEPAPGASFSEQISPVAIPVLSLDEYAKFRARLRVHGEDHVATWQSFGVLSKAAKDALQSRFAQYFQRDAQAQREFLALVEKYLKEQELNR